MKLIILICHFIQQQQCRIITAGYQHLNCCYDAMFSTYALVNMQALKLSDKLWSVYCKHDVRFRSV